MPAPPRAPQRRLASALRQPDLRLVVGLALCARLVALAFVAWPMSWADAGIDYGSELGSIARNLCEGRGFSSPFGPGSQPTAWLAPLVPLLWAAVFHLAGPFSQASLVVLVGLQLLAGALACGLYVRIALWSLERAGVRGTLAPFGIALVVAVWPESVARQMDLWYFAFQDLALAWMFLEGLRWLEVPSGRRGLRLGLAAGLLASINPGPLPLFAALLAVVLWSRRRQWRAVLGPALMAAGACALVLAPWTARNHRVLGAWVPLRSNFGLELLQGNGPRGTPCQQHDSRHPAVDRDERERYGRLGELEYMRQARSEALQSIRAEPALFLRRSSQRLALYWGGDVLDRWTWTPRPPWWQGDARTICARLVKLACAWVPLLLVLLGLRADGARRLPGRAAYAALLVLLPLPYYLTHVHQAYSYTVRPYLLLLAILLFAVNRRAQEQPMPAAPARRSPDLAGVPAG